MRLLLAEDEKHLSKALVTILQHNNYSVDAVYDGQSAIDYLETGLYDCAILDIMMPKVDGLTVLKHIRSNNNRIPIIMLTAKSEIDDRCLGLDLGADDYLTKPFATPELLARIRALTRRKEVSTSNILSYYDLKLNRLTFELSYQDKEIKLCNKEFQMMEMFMLHHNQVISTEQFMVKIWGFDCESEINTVWVYVSYLRKKLKQLNAPFQINLSRNIGYLLEKKDD
jgi:DNA-binding response regulator